MFTLYYKIFTFPALRLKIAKFPDFNYCAIIARFRLFFNRIWTKKSPSCENFNKLSLFHKEIVKKKFIFGVYFRAVFFIDIFHGKVYNENEINMIARPQNEVRCYGE